MTCLCAGCVHDDGKEVSWFPITDSDGLGKSDLLIKQKKKKNTNHVPENLMIER